MIEKETIENQTENDIAEAISYIEKNYEYTEKRAKNTVTVMSKYPEIFDEFLNYTRTGDLCKEDGSKTIVEGYTAEELYVHYPLSVLGTYKYMVYLTAEPKDAIIDLERDCRESKKLPMLFMDILSSNR